MQKPRIDCSARYPNIRIFNRTVCEVLRDQEKELPFPRQHKRREIERCHLQPCGDGKGKPPERVPISLYITAVHARLQKWVRRRGSDDAMEWLYKGMLFQGDGYGNRNTGKPGVDTTLRSALLSAWKNNDWIGKAVFQLSCSHWHHSVSQQEVLYATWHSFVDNSRIMRLPIFISHSKTLSHKSHHM